MSRFSDLDNAELKIQWLEDFDSNADFNYFVGIEVTITIVINGLKRFNHTVSVICEQKFNLVGQVRVCRNHDACVKIITN